MNQAQSLAYELSQRYAQDTVINTLWLPVVRAALSLQRGQTAQALEDLQATARYEAAAEFWPQYLRAQAHLQLQRNAEAAAVYQQVLDHRGYAPLSVLYSLARLGLARATRNRKAYDEFLLAWKDADADLPLLPEARKAFAQP